MGLFKNPDNTLNLSNILAVSGVAGAFGKLFIAGIIVHGIKMSDFGGGDFAMVAGPFLALLAHKHQMDANSRDKE